MASVIAHFGTEESLTWSNVVFLIYVYFVFFFNT